MFTVDLLNVATGKEFKKVFDSPYLLNKFLNKCRFSKRVKVLSYGQKVW